jgi:hypothetical protein
MVSKCAHASPAAICSIPMNIIILVIFCQIRNGRMIWEDVVAAYFKNLTGGAVTYHENLSGWLEFKQDASKT